MQLSFSMFVLNRCRLQVIVPILLFSFGLSLLLKILNYIGFLIDVTLTNLLNFACRRCRIVFSSGNYSIMVTLETLNDFRISMVEILVNYGVDLSLKQRQVFVILLITFLCTQFVPFLF